MQKYIYFSFSDKSEQLVRIFNLYLLTHVRNLGSLKMLDDEKVKNLYKSVKERYFKGKSITANDFDKLTEFLGHVYFAIPAIIWLQDRIKRVTSPSYFCQFSYVGNEKTPTDLLVKRQASGNIFLRIIYYLYLIDKSISSFKNLRYLRPSTRKRNSSISYQMIYLRSISRGRYRVLVISAEV